MGRTFTSSAQRSSAYSSSVTPASSALSLRSAQSLGDGVGHPHLHAQPPVRPGTEARRTAARHSLTAVRACPAAPDHRRSPTHPAELSQDDPAIQSERTQFLTNVKEKGFSDGYQGIRVTSKGRRFRIENVTLWTVSTGKAAGMEGEQGKILGQAATFREFTWLDDGDAPECDFTCFTLRVLPCRDVEPVL